MVARPILYSFRRCPYAMRARLALLESGLSVEIREVKLSAKPEQMLAASPKATVPVLILPDGTVVDESLDVMRWALGQNDPHGWLKRCDEELIAANDGPFKHHLDRYKYSQRHDADPIKHRTLGLEFLTLLDSRLKDHANLCGNPPGLTDAALFPFVRQFAEVDRQWFDDLPLAHLQSWLMRHLESPQFATAMVKLAPWQMGDKSVLFPSDCELVTPTGIEPVFQP